MATTITQRIDPRAVTFAKASDGIRKRYFISEEFNHQPALSAANGYADPSGTAAALNIAMWRNGLFAQYSPLGAGQTLLGPLCDFANSKTDISQDQTDDEGVQYIFGGAAPGNPLVHTVQNLPAVSGTPSSVIELDFDIVDVSGTDDCAFGFRKVEAVQANIDDYDEMAVINVISGAIYTETILNNAATVATDSGLTWIDTARKKLRLTIEGRRVRFYVQPSGSARVEINPQVNFRFDAGEVVVPFFYFLQAAVAPGKVNWYNATMGRRRELEEQPMSQS